MEIQKLETIIAELTSDDWLTVAKAIRKVPLNESGTSALPSLFELTLHDKAPIVSHSRANINRLGRHAVRFLQSQTTSECPRHRAEAINLLLETGCRWASSVRLHAQRLDSRRDNLPDWGIDPEEIISLFKSALKDESLEVRYNAASALEEFGRHIPETVPVFIDMLQTGQPHQQNWAALHLGRIGPPAVAASQALEVAVQSPCKYTALAASNALHLIGHTTSSCAPIVTHLRAIGFWRSWEALFVWPHPREIVGEWDPILRERVTAYLDEGVLINEQLGFGEPRFREDEGINMGCGERTDGFWVWPESLSHYVRKHNVLLPKVFVNDIEENSFSVLKNIYLEDVRDRGYSFTIWNNWCQANRSNKLLSMLARLYMSKSSLDQE